MAIQQTRAFDALATHPRLGDIVGVVRALVGNAATARRSEWHDPETVRDAAAKRDLTAEETTTPFGDVLTVLERGPEDDAERALACALWAHVLAADAAAATKGSSAPAPASTAAASTSPTAPTSTGPTSTSATAAAPAGTAATSEAARAPDDPRSAEDRVASAAGDLLWLATHTPFDATGLVDRALGDRAGDLWEAVADRVRRIETGRAASLGRGEALVGCAALALSTSPRAAREAEALAKELEDPTLARVLATRTAAPAGPDDKLSGEMMPSPRGPFATAALAFTGLLFAMHAVRLVARLALAYRRPAEVTLSDGGIRIRAKTELLGRTLRDREIVIVRSGLALATREVRYPRVALYAGLLALAVGSTIGVATFVDGVRAASPSLLLAGLVVVALGIGLDFVLASLGPGVTGRCRVAFSPRTGRPVCVADVDVRRADAALARLNRAPG